MHNFNIYFLAWNLILVSSFFYSYVPVPTLTLFRTRHNGFVFWRAMPGQILLDGDFQDRHQVALSLLRISSLHVLRSTPQSSSVAECELVRTWRIVVDNLCVTVQDYDTISRRETIGRSRRMVEIIIKI